MAEISVLTGVTDTHVKELIMEALTDAFDRLTKGEWQNCTGLLIAGINENSVTDAIAANLSPHEIAYIAGTVQSREFDAYED